jgi:hypothetical protein
MFVDISPKDAATFARRPYILASISKWQILYGFFFAPLSLAAEPFVPLLTLVPLADGSLLPP